VSPGPRVAVAVAVLVAAPFLLVGLGAVGFDDPGEGMHAEIARELLASGDPLALTLNGVRYADKPPLLYLLEAAAFRVSGASEGAARVVPALSALAAVAATAWLGSRLLGPTPGFLAGLALLGSTLFFVHGRYVRPETLFVAAIAGGFAFVLAGLGEQRRALVGLGLATFGVAGLAKDPLGALAPPLVVALALAACGLRRESTRLIPWTGLALCVALGCGWWIAAEVRTPGSIWYTVVDNKLLNVARARVFPDEDVPLSALEFLVVALLGAVPWSLAAAVTVSRMVRRRAWRDPGEAHWTVLALWAVAVLAVTVMSRFRLPHYGLPAYPALALLAARAWIGPRPTRLAAAHAGLFAALALVCGAAWLGDGAWFTGVVAGATDVATRKTGVVGQAPPFPSWAALRPLAGWTALVLGGGAVAMTALVVRWRDRPAATPAPASREVLPEPTRGDRHAAAHVTATGMPDHAGDQPSAAAAIRGARRGLVGFGVAVVTMLAVLPASGSAIALVSEHRSVRRVAHVLTANARPDDVVAHEGPIENSGALEWYSGRRPVIVDGRRSVLGFGATRADARDVFWDGARLRAAWEREGARVWLVTIRAPDRSLAASLPGARLVVAGGGRWLYASPAAAPPP